MLLKSKNKTRLSLVLTTDDNGRFLMQTSLTPVLKAVDSWLLVSATPADGTFQLLSKAAEGIPGKFIKVDNSEPTTMYTAGLGYARTVADWMLVLHSGFSFEQPIGTIGQLRYHLRGDALLLPVISGTRREQVLYPSLFRCMANLRFRRRVVPPLEIVPGSGDIHVVLDVVIKDNGAHRYSKFHYLNHLRRCQSAAPQPPQLRVLNQIDIADSYRRLNNMQAAFNAFHNSLEMLIESHDTNKDQTHKNDWWYVQYHLALIAVEISKPFKQIEQLFHDAHQIDSQHAEPHYQLARLYESKGDTDKAAVYYQSAFNITLPAKPWVDRYIYEFLLPYHYAQLLYRQRRFSHVISMVNQLSARFPTLSKPSLIALSEIRSQAYRKVSKPVLETAKATNQIVVITSFKNAGKALGKCVDSLKSQDYPHFRVVLIDDMSTDGCVEKYAAGIQDDPRFTIVRNQSSKGLLQNQVDAVFQFCSDDDIVVYIDGDDWLLESNVLGRIDASFESTGCWVFYSQYVSSNGTPGCSRPFTEADDLNNLDHLKYMFPLHVTAHRAGLMFCLREDDPDLNCFRGQAGLFLGNITDMVMFRALFPLAGKEKIFFLDEVLYAYNTLNPTGHGNDAGMNRQQAEQYAELAEMAPLNYIPLTNYKLD